MRNSKGGCVVAALAAAILATAAWGTTLTVCPDGSAQYATIQAAITASAAGDTLQLCDGTYRGDGNRDLDFQGKAIVLRSASGQPEQCVIDCEGTAEANHRGFYFHNGEGEGSVVRGVTIRGGYAVHGGGIYFAGSNPTITGNIVTQNYASGNYGGGGLFCDNNASPTITGNLIHANSSRWGAGGIYTMNATANPEIIGNTVVYNTSIGGIGGIYLRLHATTMVSHNIIAYNEPQGLCALGEPVSCNDVFGNAVSNYYPPSSDQTGINGNISEDPMFCGVQNPTHPFTLDHRSPCAPQAGSACGLLGAFPPACGVFAIDGYVTDMLGQPAAGVIVTRSGDLGGSELTDATGFYSFADNIAGGNYTLTPAKDGCSFDPVQRSFTGLAADQHNQDFRANCGLQCFDFRADPNLLQYVSSENSVSTYVCLPGWVAMPDGGSFATEFYVDASQSATGGHSSVMGPRTCSPDDLTDLRLNLHYDQAGGPFFSLSAPGSLGQRTPLAAGHYRAVVTRVGDTAAVVLTNLDAPATPFTDTVAYVWEPFNAFLLAYDYYGGGYCAWDGSEMVAFKSDRGSNFIEGRIDYLCLPPVNTYAIDGYITDVFGQPVADVTLTRSGDLSGSVVTDAAGFYSFAGNIAGGSYTLTPAKDGCSFDPVQRSFTDLAADQHNQDFRANCGLQCFDFRTDPNLQRYPNEDGSVSTYLCLPGWVAMPDGGSFATEFYIDASQSATGGHSSVMGPRTSTPDDLTDLRLNLHYDQPDGPSFSLWAPGSPGQRTPLVNGRHRAVVTRVGDTAVVLLTNLATGATFTDTVNYVWEPFNAFLLAYDYYGGGYCNWDGSEMVAFRSDRSVHFIEGRIDYLCVPQVNTVAIDGYARDMLGQPMGGIRVIRTGDYGGSAVTDSAGFYSFPDNMLTGSFTLTPNRGGCTFTPTERTYEDLAGAMHEQDFEFACGPPCPDFATDPGLLQFTNDDGSVSTYLCFGSTVYVPDGLSLVVDFVVTGAQSGSPGHSSVMGPRSCNPSSLVDLRLNLHYDQEGGPSFSLSAPGSLGQRTPLTAGSYRAVVTKLGNTATVTLTGPDSTTVFTDTVDYVWQPFDAFLLAYDYYGGGYCQWDSAGVVRFKSDRGPNFIEGYVSSVCRVYTPSEVDPILPVPSDLALRAMLPSGSGAPNRLSYAIPHEGNVLLDVYDIGGRHVANLVRGEHHAGVFQAHWAGTLDAGGRATAGLYFAVLRLDHERVTTKLVRW